jgi:hypothetical protein
VYDFVEIKWEYNIFVNTSFPLEACAIKKSRDAVIKIKLQRLPKQCLSKVLTDLVGILLVLSINNEKAKN